MLFSNGKVINPNQFGVGAPNVSRINVWCSYSKLIRIDYLSIREQHPLRIIKRSWHRVARRLLKAYSLLLVPTVWLGLNWKGLPLWHDLLGERILELLWLELLLNLPDLRIVQRKGLVMISRMILGIGGFCIHHVWDVQLIRWLLLLSSVVIVTVKAASPGGSGARQDAALVRSHQLLIHRLYLLWLGVHLLLLL